MAIFEGPDRNRNIIIIVVAVVVLAIIYYLYTTGRPPNLRRHVHPSPHLYALSCPKLTSGAPLAT